MNNIVTVQDENFQCYVSKIRKEVQRAAENWFHIAYYVYEMKYFKYYEGIYDNITDCCLAEFGFKKSTTYNFINIVEQFGTSVTFTVGMCSKTSKQYVRYVDFMAAVRGWSYSQLVAMLSLSSAEREKASPLLSSRQIRELKSDSSPKLLETNVEDNSLSKRLESLENELSSFRKSYDDLSAENERLKSENQSLKSQIEELTCMISYMDMRRG